MDGRRMLHGDFCRVAYSCEKSGAFWKKSILGLWQCAVRKQEGKQVFIVKGNMDSKYQTYKGPQGFSSVEIQRTLFNAVYEKKMDKLCIFKKKM